MLNEPKILICEVCGNIVTLIKDTELPISCCGEEMTQLEANSVDAAVEKHVPVVTKSNNVIKVNVGSISHPMTPEHLIEWVMLQTEKGIQVKYLTADDKPEVEFSVTDDIAKTVYAYCNLHGLWKASL